LVEFEERKEGQGKSILSLVSCVLQKTLGRKGLKVIYKCGYGD